MYTLNKKSIAFEGILYTPVYKKTIFCMISALKAKHQLVHLCHTYCKVLYEMYSGKFIQQLMKV